MSAIYEKLIRPALFNLTPEAAHELGINALKIGLGSKFAQDLAAPRFASGSFGELKRFGLSFKNPLGVAAGFDKNGVVVNQLAALGFGFVEVGTITFHPQKGNEKPRLFRLPEDKALINRLGFNNDGAKKIVERLKKIEPNCVVGVNIGKNKDVPNEEAIENYLQSFDLAFWAADYIAVNVSSPNTPNLRELQHAANLEKLLRALQERNFTLARQKFLSEMDFTGACGSQIARVVGEMNFQNIDKKPLLVKIAPDLSEAEIEAIVDISLKLNMAGIIATNTTIKRENLKTKIDESGGLSGKPLQDLSNEAIKKIYKYSKGKLPIVGVGGVFTAEDAFEKIACGASLIQAYTGFIYRGLSFARDINWGLLETLRERGFKNLDEATGTKTG
jgi:dihydroorotate dehydrogenase